jgi:hypothetical protein
VPVIPATWGSTKSRIAGQANGGVKQDPISKITNAKRADGVIQMLKHLPSKHEAPSSTLISLRAKKKINHVIFKEREFQAAGWPMQRRALTY